MGSADEERVREVLAQRRAAEFEQRRAMAAAIEARGQLLEERWTQFLAEQSAQGYPDAEAVRVVASRPRGLLKRRHEIVFLDTLAYPAGDYLVGPGPVVHSWYSGERSSHWSELGTISTLAKRRLESVMTSGYPPTAADMDFLPFPPDDAREA